jgi:hypothetical protein
MLGGSSMVAHGSLQAETRDKTISRKTDDNLW